MTAVRAFPQHGDSDLDSSTRFARSVGYTPSSSLKRTTSTSNASPPSISLRSFNSAPEDDFDLPAYDVACSSSSSSSDETPDGTDVSHDSPTPTQADAPPEYQTSDDSCVRTEPTSHRDYVARPWKTEEAVHSWRYVSSQKRAYERNERLRLMNASWRAWHVARYNMPPVPPSLVRWYVLAISLRGYSNPQQGQGT